MSNTQKSIALPIRRDRRLKASLVVLLVWGTVSLLHWRSQALWLLVALTFVLAVQTMRMLVAKPLAPVLKNTPPVQVSILVAAKNESAVLPNLVQSLFQLDYPIFPEIWIIDDGSTDETPQVLSTLQARFPALRVHYRTSKGGKSGALNSVFPFTQGELVLVCDADAQLPADFLQQTVPLFQQDEIGAVQVRKAIANQTLNFWTRCQQMEMSCDSVLQVHRLAVGGMTELRGNGMMVRRQWLEQCNGWNEDTVTDDLDLTFRLYLAGTEIAFVSVPSIQEEGVTTWKQLWHQRCRWAEGGYQRYLDYFPQLLTLGWVKGIDLVLFFLLQFLLPIAIIPDLLWTIFHSHFSILFPLQSLLSLILTASFIAGLYQFQGLRGGALLWATVQGSVYMLHWIPIMILITVRLCVQPQTLHWVKTDHQGCD